MDQSISYEFLCDDRCNAERALAYQDVTTEKVQEWIAVLDVQIKALGKRQDAPAVWARGMLEAERSSALAAVKTQKQKLAALEAHRTDLAEAVDACRAAEQAHREASSVDALQNATAQRTLASRVLTAMLTEFRHAAGAARLGTEFQGHKAIMSAGPDTAKLAKLAKEDENRSWDSSRRAGEFLSYCVRSQEYDEFRAAAEIVHESSHFYEPLAAAAFLERFRRMARKLGITFAEPDAAA